MRWIVLEAAPRRPDDAGGLAPCASLVFYDSASNARSAKPVPLYEVQTVLPIARETETGSVNANFAIVTGARTWELAARDEEEASEWTRLLRQTLFAPVRQVTGRPTAP